MDVVRSREKLNRHIEKSINDFFNQILDYAEFVVKDKQDFDTFRSRILRVGNNKIRDIKRELELYYKIEYVPLNEDVVEIKKFTKR